MRPRVQQPDDELNELEAGLALMQGKGYEMALRHMIDLYARGQEKQIGDYHIGYAVDQPIGVYTQSDGVLQWENPEEENMHLVITVRSAFDGRFIPGLTVTVTILDHARQVIGSERHALLWHPWLSHYGMNWTIPERGSYRLLVHVKAPLELMRHDRLNGMRFSEDMETSFDDVDLPS